MTLHTIALKTRLLLIAASLFLTGITISVLAAGAYSPVLVVLWIFSILLFLMGVWPRTGGAIPAGTHVSLYHVLLVGILLLPVAVRLLYYTPTRIHGDDLLTAYFSLEYHPRTANFFAGVPEDTSWVASFPPPYFLFQKLFLHMAGTSVFTVKLSVLPYVFTNALFIYLVSVTLTNIPAAITAVWVYAFMAISIYLETLGLHFISSTAIFLVFFYLLIRAVRNNSAVWFAATGIACAGSYLSYTSSYIAFPLLGIALIFYWLAQRTRAALVRCMVALVGFAITIAPFATYATATRNYFLERISQVSLIGGAWSAHKDTATAFPAIFDAVWDNLALSSKSLVVRGIGGHGGYTFDRLAFFNTEALILFVIGTGFALFLARKRAEWWLVLLVILSSFATGMVLTIPPPAFHRLSLTFPFIAIISALPVYGISRMRTYPVVLSILVVLAYSFYAFTNARYAERAIRSEFLIEDAAVIRYVDANFPNRHVHIAAFPSFALEKQWYFFPARSALSIDTQYHSYYLSRFDPDERYLYIVTLPGQFRDQFIRKDPTARYIQLSDKYGILVNLSE